MEYKFTKTFWIVIVDTFIATEANNPRKATSDEIAKVASTHINNVHSEPDVNKALVFAKSISDKDSIICVCGSLYLLGDVNI